MAREANFEMLRRSRDISKASRANCFLPSEGEKRSRTVRKNLSTPKKEKKNEQITFLNFSGIFVYRSYTPKMNDAKL